MLFRWAIDGPCGDLLGAVGFHAELARVLHAFDFGDQAHYFRFAGDGGGGHGHDRGGRRAGEVAVGGMNGVVGFWRAGEVFCKC